MSYSELKKKKKVMVAMSGGVDSSVAAYLLKKEGFKVSGVTMCLGVKDGPMYNPRCCGSQSINDAKNVCLKLGIVHYVLDLSDEMEKFIIRPFTVQYLSGKTPNPCVDCNRYLKFGVLMDRATATGFDYIATGHYAKIQKEGPDYFLMKSRDKTKDQSYFLYSIEKEKLPGILFPLADHTKAEVRKIAKESGLPVAEKAESQEVCFVPDDDYRKFIRENAPARSSVPGNIVDFEGNIIGKHEGIEFFTVGQRKGLRISSAAPLYVIKIDACKNEITAGERRYLKSRSLIAGCINILAGGLPSRATAKIRYNHRKAPCELKILKDIDTGSIDRKKTGPGSSNDFKIEVIFDEPQESVTPGQSVVFYDSDTVLGGGIIESSRSS